VPGGHHTGWYFPELAALFLVGAVLVGLVGGLGYNRYLRFVAPLLGLLLILTCLFILLGMAVPALGGSVK
jgi:uncharacterized ion transporter superfamily protein YfcC